MRKLFLSHPLVVDQQIESECLLATKLHDPVATEMTKETEVTVHASGSSEGVGW